MILKPETELKACTIDEPSPHMTYLKEIKPTLKFSEFSTDAGKRVMREVAMKGGGTSFMWEIFYHSAMSIAEQFCSAGEFNRHEHDEWELLLVYHGEMQLYWIDEVGNEQTKTLKPKDFHYLEANVTHWGTFNSDTRFIAITIPANEAWPHDTKRSE